MARDEPEEKLLGPPPKGEKGQTVGSRPSVFAVRRLTSSERTGLTKMKK